MATFRFLHCADLHLDSPLRGLEADPDAPVEKIRGATRDALKNLVDFALAERVDFVVCAGDLYDGDWQDWRTGRFLLDQIRRLTDAAIPFVAIRGNHDAASVITQRFRMPSDIARMLDHTVPETYRIPGLGVAIHGQSFATRSVTDNIAMAYPRPEPDQFNIGLLHSSVGEREGHDTYASCSVEQLRAHGYDYWGLGHVHTREVLSRDPWVVFPGNLQGRHVNEAGGKGAMLVTVTDGKIVGEPTHICFDTVRWARLKIVLSEHGDEDAALTQVRSELARALEMAEGRLLAARIELTGACAVHDVFSRDLGAARERIKAETLAIAGPELIWTEMVDIATTPRVMARNAADPHDARTQLIQALNETTGADIAEAIKVYAAKMLEKANPIRQAIGESHIAAAAVDDKPLDDLVRRARDLLLGTLDA